MYFFFYLWLFIETCVLSLYTLSWSLPEMVNTYSKLVKNLFVVFRLTRIFFTHLESKLNKMIILPFNYMLEHMFLWMFLNMERVSGVQTLNRATTPQKRTEPFSARNEPYRSWNEPYRARSVPYRARSEPKRSWIFLN